MSDHHRPVQAPPPSPPPLLWTARRTTGTVLTDPPEDDTATPPSLERKASVAGNILLVHDDHQKNQSSYLLQRKIKQSANGGSVRVGFVLQPTESGVWELKEDADSGHEMVAVKIRPKSDEDSHNNELSALQWITANDPEGKGHLLGPTTIASDGSQIYIITPYQKDGTLFDYCDQKGKLSESEARYFFCQMLEVSPWR